MMAVLCAWRRRASLSLSWSGGEEPGTSPQPGWGPTSPELSGPPTHSIMGMLQHPAPSSCWIPLLLHTAHGTEETGRTERQSTAERWAALRGST